MASILFAHHDYFLISIMKTYKAWKKTTDNLKYNCFEFQCMGKAWGKHKRIICNRESYKSLVFRTNKEQLKINKENNGCDG